MMPDPQQTTGPYSALFNYEELKKEEEARRKQQEENQLKIMRTNSIGEALRLIGESAGASMGATINRREQNPAIQNASNNLLSIRNLSDTNLERLRLTDLGNKQKDLAYQQSIDAADRDLKNKKDAADQAYQREKDLIGARGDEQRKTDAAQSSQRINEYTAKQKADQQLLNQQVPRNQMRDKNDIAFIEPGTQKRIYIRPEEIAEMQYQLTKGKMKYDPELDAALKALMKNELVRDDATIAVLKKNWDKIKYVLPEYAGQRPQEDELTPKQKRVADYDKALESINSDPQYNARQRRKAVEKLNKDYSDLFLSSPQNDVIQPGKDGITDVSLLFN